MEKNKILALNHKMNMMPNEVKKYIDNINKNSNLIVFPMNIYLPYFLNKDLLLGTQNISEFDEGSYTGEVSAKAVKMLGIDYVLIGHSERKEHFLETGELINKKIKQSLKNNLNVILCIGEKSKDENKEEVLKEQISTCLNEVFKTDKIIIAYEPIWAIGTGLTPTNDEIKDTIDFIKKELKEITNNDLKVLYGGSVNDKNIETLNEIKNLDGYLVGGASLDYKKVNHIIKVVL